MFKRSLCGIVPALLLVSMFVQNLPAQPWRESQTTSTKFEEYLADSLITINESEYVWYGDFIVNETDTVIIRNCIFTVEDGYIYVYGSLEVENSTIEIHRLTYIKRIFVYGNFTLSKSIIKGGCYVNAYDNSRVSVFNSTFRSVAGGSVNINISDSTMLQAGGGFIQNSNVGFAVVDTLPQSIQIISNSNITQVGIYVSRSADLELRPGYVENLTFSSEYGINSIINSFVESWHICNIYADLRLINSTIELMGLDVMNPFDGTATLRLKTDFIEYQNIYVENNYFNITVMNSTVKEWELTVIDGNIDIRDSSNVGVYCASSTEPLTHPNVSIHNSTMTYVVARDLSGNVTVFDSLTNSMMFSYSSGSMNLSLQEGYQDYINFYNEIQNSNVTLVRTIVNHWGIESSGTVNIINSTITGQHPDPFFAGLNLFQNSNATVYNSNLTGARLVQFASLTLVNSTIDRIYAYADSPLEVQKITAINSTIGTIITAPYQLESIQLELIGSTIMAEICLRFAMSSGFMSASVLDDCEVPLPEDIKQMGKYLHFTTTYDDIIEAQVRLYYDSYQLSELGISPDNLIIYTLDESSNDWRVCQIQGINQNKNYVWANVTHFSCFVLGSSPRHDISVTNALSSKTIVGQGYNMSISIMTFNSGSYTENINITIYANTTIIGEINNIELPSRNFTIVQYTWNTSGFAYGNYTISAYAWPVAGETDTSDNTFVDGLIKVSCVGDLNGDYVTDGQDYQLVKNAIPSMPELPRWNPNADLNDDGIVDGQDFQTVKNNIGQSTP